MIGVATISHTKRPLVCVLDLRGDQRPLVGSGGPLAVVCGLPVLIRTLLVVERMAFHRAVLLVHPEDADRVFGELNRHTRLKLVCRIERDSGSSAIPAVRALVDLPPDSAILYWPATVSFGRQPPVSTCPLMSAAETIEFSADGFAAKNACPALIMTSLGVLSAHGHLSPAALCLFEEQRGRLLRAPLEVLPVIVTDSSSTRRAEQVLLQSLRKDADGVVARFDRNISLAISRRLMALPIKPNHVTLFAALVGIFCGWIVSRGGYVPMLVGAFAFQFNSILDGVDGEIARAKLLESRAGQWLDTLADDLSNLAFMIGVSVGSYRTWGSRVYLALGAVSTLGFLIASTLMYHYLITRAHSGDLNDFALPWEEGEAGRRNLALRAKGGISRVIGQIKWVARRDVYVFLCVVFGIFGQLRIMAWLFAAGTTMTWATIIAYRGLVPLFQRAARQST